MKMLKIIFFSGLYLFLSVSCKTVSVKPVISNTDQNIIGYWEGCDGRVVKFTKNEDNSIVGHYEKLGELYKYKFAVNEEGYRLNQQNPGVYKGLVKWKTISGEETWKEVTITIENDIYKDNGSDGCSKEMKRIDI